MSGPGEYVADRTEGITRVEDLPKAKLVKRSRNRSRRPCPQCGRSCYRHRTMQRTLHDLGDLVAERPRDIQVTYSQHHCCKCRIYFNADMLDLAPPKSHYTRRVIALELVNLLFPELLFSVTTTPPFLKGLGWRTYHAGCKSLGSAGEFGVCEAG